jgi:hypothetical protein
MISQTFLFKEDNLHFHPILLVQADSLEEAKSSARIFCEDECGEHSYFDYGGIVDDEDTEWNKPLNDVKSKLPDVNHLTEAEKLLAKANEALEQNNHDTAGYYYRKAGELYSQCFCTEYPVFNIQYYDYSREDGDDWYAIEANLHY